MNHGMAWSSAILSCGKQQSVTLNGMTETRLAWCDGAGLVGPYQELLANGKGVRFSACRISGNPAQEVLQKGALGA
ncbi:hypothetical protein [Streptomyces lushanensis]|uniref:hypothetical protein n=1 Tax=Streptomyces lushanensis TaxID=1434255 RepID=UPI00114CBC49|nr:hypothetical protein [Streptomyces lushanensis]